MLTQLLLLEKWHQPHMAPAKAIILTAIMADWWYFSAPDRPVSQLHVPIQAIEPLVQRHGAY